MALLRQCLQELRMRRGDSAFDREVPRVGDDRTRVGTSLRLGYRDGVDGRSNLCAIEYPPHSSGSLLATGYGVATLCAVEAP